MAELKKPTFNNGKLLAPYSTGINSNSEWETHVDNHHEGMAKPNVLNSKVGGFVPSLKPATDYQLGDLFNTGMGIIDKDIDEKLMLKLRHLYQGKGMTVGCGLEGEPTPKEFKKSIKILGKKIDPFSRVLLTNKAINHMRNMKASGLSQAQIDKEVKEAFKPMYKDIQKDFYQMIFKPSGVPLKTFKEIIYSDLKSRDGTIEGGDIMTSLIPMLKDLAPHLIPLLKNVLNPLSVSLGKYLGEKIYKDKHGKGELDINADRPEHSKLYKGRRTIGGMTHPEGQKNDYQDEDPDIHNPSGQTDAPNQTLENYPLNKMTEKSKKGKTGSGLLMSGKPTATVRVVGNGCDCDKKAGLLASARPTATVRQVGNGRKKDEKGRFIKGGDSRGQKQLDNGDEPLLPTQKPWRFELDGTQRKNIQKVYKTGGEEYTEFMDNLDSKEFNDNTRNIGFVLSRLMNKTYDSVHRPLGLSDLTYIPEESQEIDDPLHTNKPLMNFKSGVYGTGFTKVG